MKSFLNLDIENVTNEKYFLLHGKFFFLWVLIFSFTIFGLDHFLIQFLPYEYQWLGYLTPIFLLIVGYLTLKGLKWYFKLAFVFYVPIFVFWVLPKFILQKGKFYLFISYVKNVFNRIKKWKSTIVHVFVFFVLLVFLTHLPNTFIRISSILFAFYLLIKYNYRYARSSFRPEGFFGLREIEQIRNQMIPKDHFEDLEKKINSKESKKLSKQELLKEHISDLALQYSIISSFRNNISSTKGKSSFAIHVIFTFFSSFLFSLFLMAFINYQIFLIDSTSFLADPLTGFGEFSRYTLKAVTYGDIDEIKPNNSTTKILEMIAFMVLGLFYLAIIIASGISLMNSKIEEETDALIVVLDIQLKDINQFVAMKFGEEMPHIIEEVKSIKDSVLNIEGILRKIF